MKSRFSMLLISITLFFTTGIRSGLAAQDNRDHHPKHHHYKLIDIGTFGGPSSYFNDLALSDAFGFTCCFYGFAPVLNKQGILAGWADTSTPDPYSPFCFDPDCFVAHAFLWQQGVKTDLGVLPGGASSAALWINSDGSTIGYSQNGEIDPLLPGTPQARAVLWEQGNITDLGTFGGNQSFASAINNRGQVAGTAQNTTPDPFSFFYLLFRNSSNGTQTRAFLWDKDGGKQDLGTLGGPDATPSLVNDHGQVAGFSYTNSIPNPTTGVPTFHPFLWTKPGPMQDLGSLGGTALGSVNGINERGQVVGGTTTAGDVYVNPFLWDGTKMINLIAPPFVGNANGEASWINEAGEVVGGAAIPGPCQGGIAAHAFLWRNGAIRDLGTIAGNPISSAAFINSKTEIVGVSWPCDFSSSNAFLWEKGSMVDLNTLIPPNSPFQLFSASFIDDHGVIGAFGALTNGDMHALLLIPCDEKYGGSKGCEEDAAGAAATARVSPAPVTQHPTALPASRMPVGMLNRLRFQKSQRNPGSGTGPATDQKQEPSADTVTDDLVDQTIASPCGWRRHCGYCEVDMYGKLDGLCVSHNFISCYIQPSTQCPKGRNARSSLTTCGGFGTDRIALRYPCSF
jgi:probable HAF family extracellular repeat protein